MRGADEAVSGSAHLTSQPRACPRAALCADPWGWAPPSPPEGRRGAPLIPMAAWLEVRLAIIGALRLARGDRGGLSVSTAR